jgi:acetylornithine deacetylase/succinyl-diaminopimelate desuccinylase-like protein
VEGCREEIIKVDRSSLLSELINLIRIKSFFRKESEIASYLVDRLSRIADRVELLPVPECGGNVLASFGGERRYLLLTHMDTIELMGEWTRNPWGQIDDNAVYGLGALDSKSSLAAMIEAIRSLREKQPLDGVVLAAVCDGEGFSRGTYHLIKSGKLNGIKGAIVGEPTGLKIMKGAYGRIVLDVEVKSRPGVGVEPFTNAIVEASKIVLHATRYPEISPGTIAPLSIKSPELIMDHPGICLLRIDHHYPPGETEDEVRKRLISYLQRTEGLKAEVSIKPMKRPTPFMEPYLLDENSDLLRVLRDSFARSLNSEPIVDVHRSVSEANYLNNIAKIPSVIIGPDGGNRHSSDEFVYIDSVVKLTNILEMALSILLNKR